MRITIPTACGPQARSHRWKRVLIRLIAGLLPLAAAKNMVQAQEPAGGKGYRVPVVALRGRALGDPGALAKPIAIRRTGAWLVVLDRSTDDQVIVMNAETGRIARTFGRQGAGPGEFLAAQSLDIDPKDSRVLWIYDINQRRFTRVEGALNSPPTGVPRFRSLSLNTGAAVWTPFWTSVGEIVATGFFPDKRIGVLDASGTMLRSFVDIPGNADDPAMVRQEAYRSYLTLSPSRRRVAIATRHSDRIDFYDVSGPRIAEGARPFGFEPAYIVQSGGAGPAMATGGDLRFGYIALASTERQVFALFSGRVRHGSGGTASFGTFLHVYDWRGRLEKVFSLDAPLLALTVSDDGSRVFGVRHEPLPNVMIYDVKSIEAPNTVRVPGQRLQ